MSRIYSIGKFAQIVGKSVSTLRRWDASGEFVAKKHQSGHRYYDESDVRRLLGIKVNEKKVIVYCRVSSQNQKDDLKSQVHAMEQFCLASGIAVDSWIQEIGGGMNFKRKKFLKIMDAIQKGEVSKLLIAHKDRLVRFGFEYFEHLAITNGCEIIVVNQESLSPQQEMVEDLMAIIHTFSCRLYGLRKYKKDIKKVIIDESHQDSKKQKP
ncbi:recombinase [Candidatus Thiomargarita nelsonii]|uniref:Recombinase n=1 Tax=Candidatus Thiomargarita nelsonii TaxID=1003181 RepID=A0A0A6PLB2_9GAMM|nr:recombinase [Candidatus Thiomargarita nelsonii]